MPLANSMGLLLLLLLAISSQTSGHHHQLVNSAPQNVPSDHRHGMAIPSQQQQQNAIGIGIASILAENENGAAKMPVLQRHKIVPNPGEMAKIGDLTADPLLTAIFRGLINYLGGTGADRVHRLAQGPNLVGEWPPPDWMELTEWAAIWQGAGFLFTAYAPHAFERIRAKLGIVNRLLLTQLVNALRNVDDGVPAKFERNPHQNGQLRLRLKVKDQGERRHFLLEQVEKNGKGAELRRFYGEVMERADDAEDEEDDDDDDEEGVEEGKKEGGQHFATRTKLLGVFRVQQQQPHIDFIFSLEEVEAGEEEGKLSG